MRHIPVMNGNDLVGILSDRDVLRGSSREVGDHAISVADLNVSHDFKVDNVMSKRPEVVQVSATLAEAAKVMVKHKFGALPVVENGNLIGIITETDLLRAIVTDCLV